jgi:hypothetical protein
MLLAVDEGVSIKTMAQISGISTTFLQDHLLGKTISKKNVTSRGCFHMRRSN